MLRTHALQHAKASLAHAGAIIGVLQKDLKQPGLSRQMKLEIRGAIYDLDKRRSLLMDAYLGLLASNAEGNERRWDNFLALYGDFCEEAKRCHARLACIDGPQIGSAAPVPGLAEASRATDG